MGGSKADQEPEMLATGHFQLLCKKLILLLLCGIGKLHETLPIPFVASANFIVTPVTQYVYLDHCVTFKCAINLTGYTIRFAYGNAINTSQVIETNSSNGGLMTTFTAFSALNGTGIQCQAIMGSNLPLFSDIAYVFIQGIYNV